MRHAATKISYAVSRRSEIESFGVSSPANGEDNGGGAGIVVVAVLGAHRVWRALVVCVNCEEESGVGLNRERGMRVEG